MKRIVFACSGSIIPGFQQSVNNAKLEMVKRAIAEKKKKNYILIKLVLN